MISENKRELRNRNIRLALASSIVARLAGILLQVLSLPIAAAALGQEKFSIYAMIGAILAWMMLSNFGISQATTLHMAQAIGEKNNQHANRIFIASLIVISLIALGVSLIIGLLTLLTPLPQLIFAKQIVSTDDVSGIVAALIFTCFVFLANQLLSVFEAAQLAHQQQKNLNIAMAIGSTLAAGLVYLTAKENPSVLNILLAVHIPVLFFRLINAIQINKKMQASHPLSKQNNLDSIKKILQDGARFLSGTTISNFLCHPFIILMIGMLSHASMASSFAAVMNALLLVAALFGYLMSPIRGALPEARQSGDKLWIRNIYKKTMIISLSYALIPCMLLTLAGPWVFRIWYSGSINPDGFLLIGAGLYIIFLAVEVIHYNFLSSLGELKYASNWMLYKSIASVLVIWYLITTGKANMTFFGLIFANFIFSLIPLGQKIHRILKNYRLPTQDRQNFC